MRTGVLAVVLLVGCFGGLFAGEISVTFYGHSCFSLQETEGPIVMIDPYGSYVPYPGLPAAADVVMITHGHIDHCPPCFDENDRVSGDPVIVWPFDSQGRVREGRWGIVEGLVAEFIEASHVTRSGGGQGLVCLFRFEIGGIVFAHLGDIGRPLTAAQAEAMDGVEVLFVPVGGAYTVDAAEAEELIDQIPSLRVVFPMHTFVAGITPWPDLAPVSTFLDWVGDRWMIRTLEESSVVLADDDLPEELEVWVLDYVR